MSFTITLLYAKDIEEEDGVTKNDLYAVITYGGKKVTTEKASDGGIIGYKYSWNKSYSFDLTDDDEIEIRLYDADVGFDDYLGRSKFTLGPVKKYGTDEHEAAVVLKDHKVKGHLKARLELAQ